MTLLDLPEEVFLHIASHLGLESVLNLARMSPRIAAFFDPYWVKTLERSGIPIKYRTMHPRLLLEEHRLNICEGCSIWDMERVDLIRPINLRLCPECYMGPFRTIEKTSVRGSYYLEPEDVVGLQQFGPDGVYLEAEIQQRRQDKTAALGLTKIEAQELHRQARLRDMQERLVRGFAIRGLNPAVADRYFERLERDKDFDYMGPRKCCLEDLAKILDDAMEDHILLVHTNYAFLRWNSDGYEISDSQVLYTYGQSLRSIRSNHKCKNCPDGPAREGPSICLDCATKHVSLMALAIIEMSPNLPPRPRCSCGRLLLRDLLPKDNEGQRALYDATWERPFSHQLPGYSNEYDKHWRWH